jgi:tetratricopeptide (TPR) repeat protein
VSQIVDATILFVDIMDSMELANYWSDKKYNDFLNEFQWTMLSQIELEGKRGITDIKIVGDELAVFYSSKNITEDIVRAIDLANALKIRWYVSHTNIKRVKEGKKIIDLGVGINTGSVTLDQRPFKKKLGNLVYRRKTFEGLAISMAKRIEGFSREGKYSKIMVGHRTKAELSKRDHDYEFEFRELHKFKGLSQAIPIFELKSCHSFQAEILAKYKNLDWAIKQLERTRVYDPTNIWLLMTLIDIYVNKKDYKKVEEFCREAIVVDDSMSNIYCELGSSLEEQKKYDDALQCFEMAIKLKWNDWYSHVGKSACLIFMGRYDECIRACEHAIISIPTGLRERSSRELFRWIFHYNMAAAYARRGDGDKALSNIKKAVEYGEKEVIKELKKDKDGDFCNLYENPQFKKILKRSQKKQGKGKRKKRK